MTKIFVGKFCMKEKFSLMKNKSDMILLYKVLWFLVETSTVSWKIEIILQSQPIISVRSAESMTSIDHRFEHSKGRLSVESV